MNAKSVGGGRSLTRPNKSGVSWAAGFLLLLPMAASAGGVVTTCTETALRAAMAGGGVVAFACDGTIVLAGTLTNDVNLTLDGTGHQVTISGSNAVRVFYVNTNVTLTLINVTIANGRGANGAGVYNAGGFVSARGCAFVENNAIGQDGASSPSPGSDGRGGALFNAGTAVLAETTFATNTAVGGAGGRGTNGVYSAGGNGASGGSGYGGAVYNSGEVTLTNCTLNANSAIGGAGGGGGTGATGGQGGGRGGNGGAGGFSFGGGLYNGGMARVVNTTLTGNSSSGGAGGGGGTGGSDGYYPPSSGGDGGNGNAGGTGSGGGIYDQTGGCLLTNCTLAFNPALPGAAGRPGLGGYGQFDPGVPGAPGVAGSASGGGIKTSGGAFLINVLLVSNSPNNGAGSIVDGGHNLSSDYSCGFTKSTSRSNMSAPLGPLLDNGGSTLTMALMPGNPAIDAGDDAAAPAEDQRGLERPVGLASDIGAYECGPPAIMAAPVSQSATLGTTVILSAPAAGYPPLAYQWYFNGSKAIPGATDFVLQLTNVQFAQGGTYTMVVVNAFGAAISPPAVLGVFLRTTVTNCTEAALRYAMAAGGTVTFASNGVIVLSSTITNQVDTVLDGTGRQVTISGSNACGAFFISSNINFSVLNLTIANGLRDTGAGIYNDGGTVSVRNCFFVGNNAVGADGLWIAHNPGGDGSGGALFNAGQATIANSTFVTNAAWGGDGGISSGEGGFGLGGAIYNLGLLKIIDCSFLWNLAQGGGGGAGHSGFPSPPSGVGGIGGNGNGGAVYNAGLLAVSGSSFLHDAALGGAGGAGGDGGITSTSPTAGANGGLGGDGNGSVLFNAGSASIVNCTLAFNSGAGGPGGAGGRGSEPPVPKYSGGSGGSGGTGGSGFGAIADTTGQIFLTNCTLAFNLDTAGSGGAAGSAGGPPGVPGSPGGSGSASGVLKANGGALVNTLLATNVPSSCCCTITDAGHNLSSDSSCAFAAVGSLNNIDPMLGPLADNGGPTWTMALLPGSPAIDAGDSAAAPGTDQRGFPRPAGLAPDIGAFEYGAMMPTLAVTRSSSTSLTIVGNGNAGRFCRLLASADLSHWVPIATNQIGSDGTVLFHDTCAPGVACRYYRLVMP